MNKTFRNILSAFFLFCLASACASAQAPETLTTRIHRFDISCRMFDPKFNKKVCGLVRSDAYTRLIRLPDRDAALRHVEAELKHGKENLLELQRLEKKAPAPAQRVSSRLVDRAQKGDPVALRELRQIGAPAIPSLLKLSDVRNTIPTPEVRLLLAELEKQADASLLSDPSALDTATVAALVARESEFIDILKRAVISLEGARRPEPPWVPFAYQYGFGLIPFLIGIVVSVIYYGRLRKSVVALMAFSYLLYFAMHGFFQFIAPNL